MANLPVISVKHKGWRIAAFDNGERGLSLTVPTKSYNKNWKNKDMKPEFVETKYFYAREIDCLLEAVKKMDALVKDYSKKGSYDDDREEY